MEHCGVRGSLDSMAVAIWKYAETVTKPNMHDRSPGDPFPDQAAETAFELPIHTEYVTFRCSQAERLGIPFDGKYEQLVEKLMAAALESD